MEGRPYKRKKLNFAIKRKMQFRLIMKVFMIVMISVLVSSTIFYFYSEREIGSTYHLFHVKADNFLDFLLPAIFLSFVISAFLGFVITLFYPHHIAGPIYRIEKELLNIGEGDLTVHVVLRKGDEVVNLADNVNTMVKGLKGKIEGIKGVSRQLGELLALGEDEKRQTGKLKEISQNLAEEIDRFKL